MLASWIAMVGATKAAAQATTQARAHHARVGVIAANLLMDAVVAAAIAAPAATVIVVVVDSQVTVAPHPQAAASAHAVARATAMA